MLPVVNQILLLLVVLTLTTVLVVSGIQVIKLLAELRETLKKTNKIIDDANQITSSVAKPIASASNFIMGIKSGVDLIGLISKLKDKKHCSSRCPADLAVIIDLGIKFRQYGNCFGAIKIPPENC